MTTADMKVPQNAKVRMTPKFLKKFSCWERVMMMERSESHRPTFIRSNKYLPLWGRNRKLGWWEARGHSRGSYSWNWSCSEPLHRERVWRWDQWPYLKARGMWEIREPRWSKAMELQEMDRMTNQQRERREFHEWSWYVSPWDNKIPRRRGWEGRGRVEGL